MFVNLTPHNVVLQAEDGTRTIVPPSGTVARIATIAGEVAANVGGVPVHSQTKWGEPVGLPEPSGAYYIVSALFAGRVGARTDVVYPGTGPNDGAVRNDKGQVEAVTRLIMA